MASRTPTVTVRMPWRIPVLLVALVASSAAAQDSWPGFRGPRYDGAAAGSFGAPSSSGGFAITWRAALGSGYSSIAVGSSRVVTLFSDGLNDLAAAFDARTGRELWRTVIAPTLRGRDGSFDGPIATPAITGDRVFGLGPRGHLFALEAKTGREIWKIDLKEREGALAPRWGFSASPLIAGGALVVSLGAKPSGAIAGFDPATGALRWRAGDDVIAYQSPVLMNVRGRELVIAVGDTRLFALDPATGKTLLDHPHGGEQDPMGAESMVPVPSGEGRLFLKHRQDLSTMVRLSADAAGQLRVETLWTKPVLRLTYLVPVYHQGFLYGMNGRMTLTCVDAQTGEQKWRSREPGDGFPMVVGDDLVMLTKDKTLHVAKASPAGWSERARISLFNDTVWASPAFAHGAIFARSHGEIARVDWEAARAATTEAPRPRTSRFAQFLDDVRQASDKATAVDRFLASIPPGPFVDWPDRVVFLYRGAAKDAAIMTDLNGDRREDPMWRVSGTDLFWYETSAEPDARFNYHFVRDFDEPFPDPRNPWLVPAPNVTALGSLGRFPAQQSSLAMPGFARPPHLADLSPAASSRMEARTVTSSLYPGATVALTVYLPAGYDAAGEKLPLAVVLDGDAARDEGLIPRSLDHLIPQRVTPMVVAFVGPPSWGASAPATSTTALAEEALANLVANEVVPALQKAYRLESRREQRAVIGMGVAANRAAHAAFRWPGVFGALGMQSLIMVDTSDERLRAKVRPAAETPMRIYLDWARYERRAVREALDMRAMNARFAAFLREQGYRPAGGEAPDGSGWAGWRNRTDVLFGALFPSTPRSPR